MRSLVRAAIENNTLSFLLSFLFTPTEESEDWGNECSIHGLSTTPKQRSVILSQPLRAQNDYWAKMCFPRLETGPVPSCRTRTFRDARCSRCQPRPASSLERSVIAAPSTRVGNTRLLLPTVKGPQGWRVTFPRMRRNLPKTWRLEITLTGSFPACGLAEGAQLTFQKTEVRVGWAPFSSGRIHVHMPQIVGRIHSLADAEVMEAGRFRTHRRASL